MINWSALNLASLRNLCQFHNLDANGSKTELIARLESDVARNITALNDNDHTGNPDTVAERQTTSSPTQSMDNAHRHPNDYLYNPEDLNPHQELHPFMNFTSSAPSLDKKEVEGIIEATLARVSSKNPTRDSDLSIWKDKQLSIKRDQNEFEILLQAGRLLETAEKADINEMRTYVHKAHEILQNRAATLLIAHEFGWGAASQIALTSSHPLLTKYQDRFPELSTYKNKQAPRPYPSPQAHYQNPSWTRSTWNDGSYNVPSKRHWTPNDMAGKQYCEMPNKRFFRNKPNSNRSNNNCCFHCGGIGHFPNNCSSKNPNQQTPNDNNERPNS